jgi:hypothetical protein
MFSATSGQKNIADLEGARKTHLRDQVGQTGDLFPLKKICPLVRKSARDKVEESGFSCSILTDDRSDLPCLNWREGMR